MIVYLITQYAEYDYCGIEGVNFTPEIFLNKNNAEKRFNELRKNLGKHSGLNYYLEEISVKDS